jgi:hypothetical protein
MIKERMGGGKTKRDNHSKNKTFHDDLPSPFDI